MKWIDLRTGFSCNNQCRFCDQGNLRDTLGSAGTDAVVAALAATGHREGVILAGGEVTTRPDLPALIASARALGFARVAIQSNGRVLAARGAAAHLRAQGLTDVIVAIHADSAAVHDWLSREKGSWRQATAGARAAAAAGLGVRLATVVVRSNVTLLPAMPGLAASLGATGLRFIVAREEGAAVAEARALVPRLSIVAEAVAVALDRAVGLRLDAEVEGVPLCLLPGHRAFAADTKQQPTRAFVVGNAPTRELCYPPACDACPLRGPCPGVPTAYFARHSDTELGLGPPPPLDVVDLDLAATASGRTLKQALVRARGRGASRVRFTGEHPQDHPEYPALLREMNRLGMAEILGSEVKR